MKKLLLLTGALYCATSLCTQDKQLESLSPYALFGLIERIKISTFSTDSFKKSGADPKLVAQWIDLTDKINLIALQEVDKASMPKFYQYIKELDHARNYIIETINVLHSENQPHTSAQAQKHLLNMYTIEDETFAEIKKVTKPSADWIQHIPHGTILTAQHQALFDDYRHIAKQTAHDGRPISEHELQGLLKLHAVTGKMHTKTLIDNLEQYIYKKEKHSKVARQCVSDLAALYPDILSSHDMSVLSNTHDKADIIIFAQAGAYENILHQILRELTQ